MSACCVPGCGNKDKTRMPFHRLPRNEKLRNLWLEKIRNPKLFDKPATTLNHMQVCSVHFEDKQYRTPTRQKLNIGVYPVLFLPVIQEVSVREFAKESIPNLFNNNDTTDNNTKESLKSNENDLQTKLDKIVEELEITQTPISSTDVTEEDILTTSNKQPDADCDPLKKTIIQNPQCTGQCNSKDFELLMKRERNWNLVINENCALQERVNVLEIQNRILDRRLKNMKILLRHYKNKHVR